MNMIYESIRNKGGLVLAPASALETMNLGTVLGTAAYGGHSGVLPDTVARQADSQETDTETETPADGEGVE